MTNASNKPEWMKVKGYLHLTPSLFMHSHWKTYQAKIENPDFIASYAFYPLIHSVLRNRKYKKPDPALHYHGKRRHSHLRRNSNKVDRSFKERPLHYASHFDALIYSYYANILNKLYECELKKDKGLNQSVIAYRKIKLPNSDFGKCTIHFAKEVFDEIVLRSNSSNEVGALTFDIKSFFSSLDHTYLKKKWTDLVGEDEFNKHHFRVYRACTNFKYVLLRDLRRKSKSNMNGFDESKLASIRRRKGYKCFFESNSDFRNRIREGKLRVYSNPFFNNEKNKMGIPQGLPISAILANIYLYDFDKWIVDNLVKKKNIFYRRYSDDLIFVCSPDQITSIDATIKEMIRHFYLKISDSKTEKFIFEHERYNLTSSKRLTCTKLLSNGEVVKNTHMTYLGFEFRGYNVTIKSANIAKYYRRIISVIKRRAKRANNARKKDPSIPLAIYLTQVKKLINRPVKVKDSDKRDLKQSLRGNYKIKRKSNGEYKIVSIHRKTYRKNSNYYGYICKCCDIFGDGIFKHQIRKRKKIMYEAMKKHLGKY